MVDNKRGKDVRQTKPHPQPLPEEGGEQLLFEMKGVVLKLIGGGDDIDY